MTNSKPVYVLEKRIFQFAKRVDVVVYHKLPEIRTSFIKMNHPEYTVCIAEGDEQQ